MDSFDIYFLGEMLPNADPQQVRRGVAKLFNMSEDAAERLFSGQALRVKKGIDADTASRYRHAFREAGALIQIVPQGAPAPSAVAPATPASGQAEPGSATAVQAPGLTLAQPGATIDDTPPPPAADIDTSGLKALPPNTGSLEDCRVDKPARPIPDISHLRLIDD